MLRSPSGRDLAGKKRAPDDGPALLAGEEVAVLGRDLAARAFAILRRDGATPEALNAIGEAMGASGGNWRERSRSVPLPAQQAGEYPLWCEEDGTFELVLRLQPARSEPAQGLGYDTWTAYAPLTGEAQVFWRDGDRVVERRLSPGDGLGLPAGCVNLALPLQRGESPEMALPRQDESAAAALLCLFGISRRLLPPPIRARLPAAQIPGAPQ